MNFENMCGLTNAQTRFAIAVLVGVVEPSHIARHTRQCPCISVAQDATHEACQGSETKVRELLGGTEDKSVSPGDGSFVLLPGRSMILLPISAPPYLFASTFHDRN